MNLSNIKNAVTSNAARQLLHVRSNSPAILFAVGVAGVVGTVVLACKATLKVEELLDEHQTLLEMTKSDRFEKEYTDEDRKKDQVLLHLKTAGKLVKLYAPALIVGVVSVSALTGSHIVLTRRNMAVTAAYAGLEKAFQQYRNRVIGEYGDNKDYKFKHGLGVKDVQAIEGDQVVLKQVVSFDPNQFSVYARFFDEQNQNWMKEDEYNFMFLRSVQNHMNDRLRAYGHVFLNDVYDALGIPRSRAGAVVGWVLGHGDAFVDFGIFDGTKERARAFVNGDERSIILDFNVAGLVYNLIEER